MSHEMSREILDSLSDLAGAAKVSEATFRKMQRSMQDLRNTLEEARVSMAVLKIQEIEHDLDSDCACMTCTAVGAIREMHECSR